MHSTANQEVPCSPSGMIGGYLSRDEVTDGKLDMAEFQSLEADTLPDRSLGSVPATGGTPPR